MENLTVAGMLFAPGQTVVVAGRPGAGKTLMGKRFASAAMNTGATPLIITKDSDFGVFRNFEQVATSDEGAIGLLHKATREFGHLVLIVDRTDLDAGALCLVDDAAQRPNVTVVLIRHSLPNDSDLTSFDAAIALGVRMRMTTAEEAFKEATGQGAPVHTHWQCARWDVHEDSYRVFDL